MAEDAEEIVLFPFAAAGPADGVGVPAVGRVAAWHRGVAPDTHSGLGDGGVSSDKHLHLDGAVEPTSVHPAAWRDRHPSPVDQGGQGYVVLVHVTLLLIVPQRRCTGCSGVARLPEEMNA
jgi:hypothetical protein